MVHKFSVKPGIGQPNPEVDRLRESLGLPDLSCWRDYYIEFETEPSTGQIETICAALSDGVETVVVHDEPLDSGLALQVAHRRGVVDNESSSLVVMCELLGLRARAGKVALTYQSSSPQLREMREALYNSSIEDLYEEEPAYATLIPAGHYLPAERYDLLTLDDDALAALGRANGRNLSIDQMHLIRDIQKSVDEPVTDVLLEALDARWSDHCLHTTWRSHGNLLARLAAAAKDTNNPNIVSMFTDNAGVWDFFDGYALAIKAETHNGPSAISAYFGQLTKLGGVLRDILGTGLGADPIGCFEYTATGPPDTRAPTAGRPTPRQIARETIRAIKEYGNTFGVPMMWSRLAFHPKYRAKPFALGGSVGLIPTSMASRGQPEPGDLVVLIGAATGNEGIHGASASSAGATMDQAAVQIGAPLEQVKFRKAIVEARDSGCLRALTDVGGAGLNSAVGEMGESCGVWINTALVPLKTNALPMWRILLSESQERMVLAVAPANLTQLMTIMKRHQVPATPIGRFTSDAHYRVFHNAALSTDVVVNMESDAVPQDVGELGFAVPYELLDYSPGILTIPPPPVTNEQAPDLPDMEADDVPALLPRIIADPEVASQLHSDSQYDSTVQGNTLYGPHYGSRHRVTSGYWAGAPVHGCSGAAILTTAFDPWLFERHPVRALRQMFCRLLGRQVLAGVELSDICLCDNFYTPHLDEHAGAWLVAMVDELVRLIERFGTPVISGKDSSAGSTLTDEGLIHVPPAVFLTGLGKIREGANLLPEQWQTPGNLLVRVGPAFSSLAATAVSRALDLPTGAIDDVDIDRYAEYLQALKASKDSFRSGVSIGAGGIAADLIVGALASGLGATLLLNKRDLVMLFAEHRCASLIEIEQSAVGDLPEELQALAVARIETEPGVWLNGVDLLTEAVKEAWSQSFSWRIA